MNKKKTTLFIIPLKKNKWHKINNINIVIPIFIVEVAKLLNKKQGEQTKC